MVRFHQNGFTYVGVLIMIAVMGLMLAGAGDVWRTNAQREKELQLLFIGNQYREALTSYQRGSPGAPEYPKTLEDLLEDRRLPMVRRHLRRLYPDPMTGQMDWELVRVGDRISGIHSRSTGQPFKKAGFDKADEGFEDASTYRDWKFAAGAGEPKKTVAAGDTLPGATPPVVPPVEPEVPPIVIPPVPRPPNSDSRCEEQRATDYQRCNELRGINATTADIARCNASAVARYAACQRRQSIPPLQLPSNR
ncbi:MAG: type II secretion system protein [Burkholderiales bacterium]|nr:type II secretion system protein [Burkholderiales bacterium]